MHNLIPFLFHGMLNAAFGAENDEASGVIISAFITTHKLFDITTVQTTNPFSYCSFCEELHDTLKAAKRYNSNCYEDQLFN